MATQATGLLLMVVGLHGGTDDKEASLKDIQTDARPAIVENASANYSYVGGSDLKSGGSGSLSEQTSDFKYDLRVPVNDTVGVGFGLGYNRIDFGAPSNSFLPDNLQSLNLNILGYYKLSNQWSLFAMFGPRMNLVNDWDSIDSKNVSLAGALGAHYEFNKDLAVQFGLAFNPDLDNVPVIPLLGLNWHFADQWTLNFGFPRTAIDYQVLTNLRLSLETAFLGGEYQTSSTYGNDVGNPQLNDRTLRYHEIRVGVGAVYSLTKNVDLELSAGSAVYREFDFKDTGYDPKAEPAPYVKTGIKVNF